MSRWRDDDSNYLFSGSNGADLCGADFRTRLKRI
nr:MAG TPA: hypothetical protein [Caudoviricetes sp.]